MVSVFPADRSYLSATFTQQSPGFAIVAFKVHRWAVNYSDVWNFGASRGKRCDAAAAAERPGSAERQPSRPADGELSHRGSSCLPAVHREAHFWFACVCHIPEVEASFFLQFLYFSAYILFKVRVSDAQ